MATPVFRSSPVQNPHPLRPQQLATGRSERSKPAFDIRDFIDIEKALHYIKTKLEGNPAHSVIAEKPVVDFTLLIKLWQMFLNDRLGDCTCAGGAHAVQVFLVLIGEAFTVEDRDIERMYEATGYDPTKLEADGSNPTDQGWTLEGAAEYLKGPGLQGEPNIVGWAGVSLQDDDAQQVALELFAVLYQGGDIPESALTQFQEGKPWTVERGSPIAGGHCFIRPKNILRKMGTHITWGGAIEATEEWEQEYIDELMVFVPKAWEEKLPEELKEAGIVDFSKLSTLVGGFTS